jgi:hypothetical protein
LSKNNSGKEVSGKCPITRKPLPVVNFTNIVRVHLRQYS